jgi:hypothetical protein
MSALCLVHEDLTIAEIDMPYAEREGRSKLRVVRDGFRFLGTILTAAAIFRPRRIVMPLLFVLVVLCVALSWGPVAMYLRERRIDEFAHIHQLLLVVLLAAVGSTLFSATYVMEHLTAAGHLRLARYEEGKDRLVSRRTFRWLLLVSAGLCVFAVAFALPGFVEYATTGSTTVHWSRFVLAMFAIVIFAQLATTALVLRVVRALSRKLEAFHGERPAQSG